MTVPTFSKRAPRQSSDPHLLRPSSRFGTVALAVAVLAATLLVAAPPVALATVPGSPSTPQAPTDVFFDDFENSTNPADPHMVNDAGGTNPVLAPGYSITGPYTAAPAWINSAACDGIILSDNGPAGSYVGPSGTCDASSIARMRHLSDMLGPTGNDSVSAYTNTNLNTTGVQLRSPQINGLTNGRYYAVRVDAAATSCQATANQPSLQLFIKNTNANPVAADFLGSAQNPCTGWNTSCTNWCDGPVRTLTSTAAIRWTGGSSAFFGVYNNTASGGGNDAAIDNLRLADVTPQIDKSFDPSATGVGGTTRLTFVVTNTTDLLAKVGWSFTDVLPAGMTVASPNGATSTCRNAANTGTLAAASITAVAGSTSVSTTASLNVNQQSCTISVLVTAPGGVGTYTNTGCAANVDANGDGRGDAIAGCTSNFSALTGLNPAGPATFQIDAALAVVPPCSSSRVFVVANNPTQLYQQEYGDGTLGLVPVGPVSASFYNAVAYNPIDNYLYGLIQTSPFRLARINPITGAVTTIAPTLPVVANGGVIDPSGTYYATPNGSSTAYRVNLVAGTFTTIALSATTIASDYTFIPGDSTYVWGARATGGLIQRINLTTGAVTGFAVPLATLPSDAGGYGAAYNLPNGNIVFLGSSSGMAHQIAITNPASATPTFTRTSSSQSLTTTFNDAGSCLGPPTDLSIDKSAPAVGTDGQSITYTMTVTNNGPAPSSGFTLTDSVPAAVSGVASTSSGCTVAGNTVQCAGPPLGVGASVVITVTGTLPTPFIAAITNTATVDGYEADPNPANDSDSAITGAPPRVRIAKISVGDVGAFAYALTGVDNSADSITTVDSGVSQVSSQVNFGTIGTEVTATEATSGSYATSWSCVDANGAITGNSAPISGNGATATIPAAAMKAGASFTCTFTNQKRPTVQLAKTAVGVPGPATFALTGLDNAGDGVTTVTSGVQVTSSQLNVGTVGVQATITETVGSTGNVVTWSCTDAFGANAAVSGSGVAITLTSAQMSVGATWTCAYVNTARPVVRVAKVSQGGVGPFFFDLVGLSATSDSATTSTAGVAAPSSQTNVGTAGTAATVTETVASAAGFSTTYQCVDSGLAPVHATISGSGRVATIPAGSMTSGAVWLCTFTNVKLPVVRVAKVSNGGVGTFTFNLTGTNNTVDPVTTVVAGTTVASTQVNTGIVGSAAGVTEAAASASGYVTSYRCVDSGPAPQNGTLSGSGTAVTIPAAGMTAGADWLCTFTNDRLATIRVVKSVPAGQSATFGFTQNGMPASANGAPAASTATSFSLTPATVVGGELSATQTYTNVPPGIALTFDELASAATSQYALVNLVCTSASGSPGGSAVTTAIDLAAAIGTPTGTATVTPVAGADVTCTFTNVRNPRIVLTKNTRGGDAAFAFSQTVTGAGISISQPSPVLLTTAGTATTTSTITGLTPAATTDLVITEPTHAGYVLSSVACTDLGAGIALSPSTTPAATYDLAGRTVTLAGVATGAQIACTFTNDKLPTVQIRKVSVGGTAAFGFVGGTSGLPASLTLDTAIVNPQTSATFEMGLSADASIAESNTANWALTAVTCADASNTNVPVVVDLASGALTIPAAQLTAGRAVVCTFTNTRTSSITVHKQWVDGKAGDAVALAIGGASDVIAGSSTAPATGSSATATGTAGAAITISEAFATGDPANYTSTLTCVNTSTGAPVVLAGPPMSSTFTMPAAAVECTYTNARISASLRLAKQWLKGVAGDRIAVATTGGTNVAQLTSTSTGGVGQTGSPGTFVTVFAGDVVTLPAEDLQVGVPADYLPALVTCTNAAGPVVNASPGATFTVSPADTSITCTYTNEHIDLPAITVVKTATPTSVALAGQTVSYTFLVTNVGNVPLTGITVTDVLDVPAGPTPAITCPATTLPAGQAMTCTASYVATQADIDHGSIDNTATVAGTSPGGATAQSAPSTARVDVNIAGAIALTKTPSVGTVDDVGDVVTYSFRAVNNGNQTLTAVTIIDTSLPGLSAITCSPVANGAIVLTPGQAVICSASYSTAQGALDAGVISNTGGVRGNPPVGPALTATASADVVATQLPDISLTKRSSSVVDTNGSGRLDAGDTIQYAFAVTNTGNVTLHDVVVTDTTVGVVLSGGPIASLAPGASDTSTYTAMHVVSQTDLDAGVFQNHASVAATPPSGSDVTDVSDDPDDPTDDDPDGDGNPDDPTITALPGVRSLALVKSVASVVDANGNGLTDAGDSVQYEFAVTNTGTVTLTGVQVSDSIAVVSGGPVTLAPGQVSSAFTAVHVLSQADVDAGGVENVATATGSSPGNVGDVAATSDAGTAPDGSVVVDPSSTETPSPLGTNPNDGADPTDDPTTVLIGASRSIAVVKSVAFVIDANSNGRTDAGDVVHYAFAVTNTGSVTLSGVQVSDSIAVVSGGPVTLAPGQTSSAFTATLVLSQADVDAGGVENVAVASGTAPGGSVVAASSDAGTAPDGSVVVDPSSTETPSPLGTNANDGADPMDDPTTLTIVPASGIELVKSVASVDDVNGNGRTDTGDVVHYAFALTNTGSVTLSNVQVADSLAVVSGGPVTLSPGQTSSAFTATHTLTQSDVDAGGIENVATASGRTPAGVGVSASSDAGTAPDGSVVVDPSSTETPSPLGTNANDGADPMDDPTTLTIVPASGIELVKSVASVDDVNGNGRTDAGDVVHYAFAVTNIGSVTLSNVQVSDSIGVVAGGPITLAPGQTSTAFTASYSLTQADVDARGVENVATVRGVDPAGSATSDRSDAGTAPDGSVVVDPSSTETPSPLGTNPNDGADPTDDPTTLTITSVAAVQAVKSVSSIVDVNGNGRTDAGDVVHYAFAVTNTGTVTLTNVHLTDLQAVVVGGPVSLIPGQTSTAFTATHVLTQGDVDAGGVENVATATASSPGGFDDVSASSDAGTAADGSPVADPAGTETPSPLGIHANSGADPGDDPTTVVVAPIAGLVLVKSLSSIDDLNGNGRTDAGDALQYSFAVTNTGSVTLTGVQIDDPRATISGGPISLAPGETSLVLTGTHVLTQSDLDAGSVENSAVASGSTPGGASVSDTSDAGTDSSGAPIADPGSTETPNPGGALPNDANDPTDDPTTVRLPSVATLSIDKSASPATVAAANDIITYTFLVTNAGTVTIHGVIIDDVMTAPAGTLAAVTCDSTTLAPGDVAICTADYTVSQADVDHGGIDNTATAGALDPAGAAVVSLADTAHVAVAQTSALQLTKTATVGGVTSPFTAAGQTIDYSLDVRNTGNLTISQVSVTDPMTGLSSVDCGVVANGSFSLAPGEVVHCTAAYIVTQADMDLGSVANTATAVGDTPSGAAAVASDSALVAADGVPMLDLDKTATQSSVAAAGEVVEYVFVVRNIGTLTVSDITVTDGLAGLGPIACTDPAGAPVALGAIVLAPNEEARCTAPYTVMQADVDAGGIDNSAGAAGLDPAANPVDAQDVHRVPAALAPAISLAKTADQPTITEAGDVITYSLVASNSGNVTLQGVTIADPMAGLSALDCGAFTNGAITLAPGASATCTATYAASQADIDAGEVVNTASTSATDPFDTLVSASDSEQVAAPPSPLLEVTKSADHTVFTAVGELIAYEITVVNRGNVTLDDFQLTDALAGLSTPVCDAPLGSTLAVGATVHCSASVATTQADLERGRLDNTATATATDPSGTDVAGSGSVSVPAARIAVDKQAGALVPTGEAGVYDETYTIRVVNLGDIGADYVLTDTFAFATGIVVTSIQVGNVEPGGIAVDAAFDGVDHLEVARDHLDVAEQHVFSVTVRVNVAGVTDAGWFDCTLASGEAGTGLRNGVVGQIVDLPAAEPAVRVGADACAEVPRLSDVSISKSASASAVAVGGTVRYVVTAHNAGPHAALDVVVSDVLPAGLVLKPATITAAAGTVAVAGSAIRWTLPAVDVGATFSIAYDVSVDRPGSITNVAEVESMAGTDPDSTPRNDVATEDDRGSAAIAVTPVGSGGSGGHGPGGHIPITGADVLDLLPIASLLTGLGIVVLAARRRRRSSH